MKNKLITLIIIGLATWLATYIGGSVFPLLGTAISAILIGMIIRHTPFLYNLLDKATNKFITSYVLKGGIVLLGFTMSMQVLNKVGIILIVVMAAVILGSYTSILVNKGVKANSKLSLLIGLGTSICGGSAIVASAPIMDAEDEDVAVAITTMFVFSMTALVVLPIVGKTLGFSDQFYGIVAGLAVNDTPSVLATSFSWSDEAGEIATLVKVAKTLFIIPITLGLVFLKFYQQRKNNSLNNDYQKVGITWSQTKSIIPMFVVYFTLAFIVASVVSIPADITSLIKDTSKLMFTFALVAIGLGVHVKQIKKAGIKPILIGAACSLVVITISVVSVMVLY